MQKKSDRCKSPYVSYLDNSKFAILDQILVTKNDSSMCSAEVDDGEIGRESNFIVVSRDSEGLQILSVDIFTPEVDPLKTELKNTKDGKYSVAYTPYCFGQRSLEIQVNGQPLTGSSCVCLLYTSPSPRDA